MYMNANYPACTCCNPLFYHFWLQIMRRKFLQGTETLTSAIMGSGSKSINAQTHFAASSGSQSEKSQGKGKENAIQDCRRFVE